MRTSASFAALCLAAVSGVNAQFDDWKFGNMFSIGPTEAGIAKATWSLTPPSVPCGTQVDDPSHQPWMSIWVGISQSISDQGTALFQPLLNWAPNNAQEGCPAPNNEWCVAASTYDGAGQQVAQPYVAIPSNSDLKFELTVDSSNAVTQKSAEDKNGKPPKAIFSSNECYLGTCGTLKGYSWSDVTVVLQKADNNFGKTLSLTGATSSGLSTSDGGKTWKAKSIKINQDFFYADGSQKQC
ncbi:hypothetical protein NM208_g4636 [Fusarium decemcellulare]|uniref:Uncharacterized protein n=1 Tax=Fusarium decemcellulare TaxID=57161 RepID=A0ACC1SKA8_9HYPO|nr:hypothetical protein NM208_g4636 [Fusarium decemcellulare]